MRVRLKIGACAAVEGMARGPEGPQQSESTARMTRVGTPTDWMSLDQALYDRQPFSVQWHSNLMEIQAA